MACRRRAARDRPRSSGRAPAARPARPPARLRRRDRRCGRRRRICSAAARPWPRPDCASIHSRMRCIDISSLGMMLAIDQHAADRRVGPAVVRIVVDAQDSAILQPDARRSLDLREQHVDLAAQPADFQMPAVERAVLDLAARVDRGRSCGGRAAADLHALVGKEIAELAPAGRPRDWAAGDKAAP